MPKDVSVFVSSQRGCLDGFLDGISSVVGILGVVFVEGGIASDVLGLSGSVVLSELPCCWCPSNFQSDPLGLLESHFSVFQKE